MITYATSYKDIRLEFRRYDDRITDVPQIGIVLHVDGEEEVLLGRTSPIAVAIRPVESIVDDAIHSLRFPIFLVCKRNLNRLVLLCNIKELLMQEMQSYKNRTVGRSARVPAERERYTPYAEAGDFETDEEMRGRGGIRIVYDQVFDAYDDREDMGSDALMDSLDVLAGVCRDSNNKIIEDILPSQRFYNK